MSCCSIKFRRAPSTGFSLVELLVVVAITAIFAGISLKVVQSVRQSSRSTSCKDHLRQLGIATLDFEIRNTRYPGRDWILEIAPSVEWIVNLDQGIQGTPSLFKCPADEFPANDGVLRTSYLGNSGDWCTEIGFSGVILYGFPLKGIFPSESSPVVSSKHVLDGTSNTALLSEALNSQGLADERLRMLWITPGRPYEFDQLAPFAAAVQAVPSDPARDGWAGTPLKGVIPRGTNGQYPGGMGQSLYNHALIAGQPSATNGGQLPTAIVTAGSMHRATNLVLCDASVQSVSFSVSEDVWRSLGNRADRIPANFGEH